MSITFPNESPACRSEREALYQRELELRPSNVSRRLRVTKAGSTSEDEGMSGIHRTWIDSWEGDRQTILNGEVTEEQAAKLVYQRKFRNTLSRWRSVIWLQASRYPATAAACAESKPDDEYGVVAIAAVKTASRSASASSAITPSRHCVHAAPNAPGVASGVVFQGQAPLK